MTLLKSMFNALDKGTIAVVDELDSSLHTYLVEELVSLFNSKATNSKGRS